MRQSLARAAILLICSLPSGSSFANSDGDVNTDGTVNLIDLLWGIQAVLGVRTLTPAQELHGDVGPLQDGVPQPDGTFDTGDVTIIARLAMNLIELPPVNQFNIGDSIGEGEAADGTIGEMHHETVWSTGFAAGDGVDSFNERYEGIAPLDYYENDPFRDPILNHADSGADMADFAAQAQAVVTATTQTPTGSAGMVTVLLGSNDVCADSMAQMTDPALFESQFRAGLDVLAASEATRNAKIHVSGIPAIYWLWNARFSNFWCRVFVWPFVPCQNLLDDPDDDCAHAVSRQDPDGDYPGDGLACQRRKTFHRTIRDTYNPILLDVLAEYRYSG
ncbi:MAG: dockerin type I repeat-containing protein, partial [Thiohalobacterales bacterium]|nr:dockerin type I repeat-containing protein [Thiohalobacterales bacterium]